MGPTVQFAARRKLPLRIALRFVIAGLIWTVITGPVSEFLFKDVTDTLLYHVVEDSLALAMGGGFIYWLVNQALMRSAMVEERLRVSRRRYRAFIVNSSEAIWRTTCVPPIPVDTSEDDHIRMAYENAHISECNDAFARMHGKTKAHEVQGKRLSELLERSPEHDESIRAFIRSGFRVTAAESTTVDEHGNTSYFLNNLVAELVDGMIIDVWGTRTDITRRRLAEENVKRNMKRLKILRAIDQAILENSTVSETLIAVLRTVSMNLSAKASSVTIFQDGIPTTFACCPTLEIESTTHDLRARSMREDCTIVAKERTIWAFRDHEPLYGYMVLPMIVKGQVVGILEFFYDEPPTVSEDRRHFFETVAGQVAIAFEDATLYENLIRAHEELKTAYDATLVGWVKAVDLRDRETEGHTQRVTTLTVQLAQRVDLPEEQIEHVRRGALLHDIGKVAIPDRILHKAGPLNEEERSTMNLHPVYAFEWLNRIKYLEPALEIPRCHHEKWDGSGYPRGLSGTDIPLSARLFAVVDVYDALTSDRPYRSAMTHSAAMEIIRNAAGAHFDPQVVAQFVAMMDGERGLSTAA